MPSYIKSLKSNLGDLIIPRTTATAVTYDNSTSGLESINTQDAIDEMMGKGWISSDDSVPSDPAAINADSLGGLPAADYATNESVDNKISSLDADSVNAANKDLSNLSDYQKALYNIGGRPNQNFARNSGFIINQRNFSSNNWTSGYGLDEWMSAGDGHLEYSGGSVKTDNQYLLQRYEPGEIDAGIYTISAICTGNISGDLGFWGGQSAKYTSTNYENGLASATVEITSEMVDLVKNGYLYILCQNSGTISRVKLEKAPSQTMAYKDAGGNWIEFESLNYGTSLAQCQRNLLALDNLMRYRAVSIDANSIDFFIPTPVTLRAKPVLQSFSATIFPFDSSSGVSGFSFSVIDKSSNGVYIRATKTTHGLTDARINITAGSLLSAEV